MRRRTLFRVLCLFFFPRSSQQPQTCRTIGTGSSFTRVTDELIRQGAQLLIVPTMDVVDWGRREHQLHARIAPIRSAEYQIPIVRVASSGISQSVNERGQLQCQAPFPGQGEMISSHIVLVEKGRLPWDRQLGPIAVILIALLGIALVFIQRQGQGSPWRNENEGH